MDTHKNIIPEILIYDTLQGILSYIRTDIETKSSFDKTILYSILQDINLGKHNYLKQAGELFSRNKEHPKHVDTRLFFDAKRAILPTMHITLSNESKGPIDSIGISEDEVVYEDSSGDKTASIYGRSFTTSITVICTSSSHQEVLLMYYVMKASLIVAFNTFELQGFQNISITGRDLQIRDDLVPSPIFSRGIIITGFYETRIRDFFNKEKLYNIIFGERTPYIP